MRCALILAALAAFAGVAAAQLNLAGAITGNGASFSAPSSVGIWQAGVTPQEFAAIRASDKTGFLAKYGVTFDNSLPSQSDLKFTVDNTGSFRFDSMNANPEEPFPFPRFGNFRLFSCDSKNKGFALTVGSFNVPSIGGDDEVMICNEAGSNCVASLITVYIQVYKGKTASYIAAVFIGADGDIVPVGSPLGTGRQILKLNPSASSFNPATAPQSKASSLCGTTPVKGV